MINFNENMIKIKAINNYTQEEESKNVLMITREINIFATLLVIFFGLFGHMLTIYVFGQRRFRIKSGSVFLLCLSVNDSLFLVIHLFEDTIRTFKDIYLDGTVVRSKLLTDFVGFINITDKYDICCRLINYLRYSLRFISAYIIVAYTLQRLSLLKSPYKFRSVQTAWNTVFLTVWLAFVFNIWVPFLFELQPDLNNFKGVKYCDMNKNWKAEYFTINVIYIFLSMLLPITIIFISNAVIIYNTVRVDKAEETTDKEENFDTLSDSSKFINANRLSRKVNFTSQIARVLILISFSYAFLSLPYFIAWCMFFYEVAFSESVDKKKENYLFSMLQICEIFFILNYSLHFYLYSASDSIFCNQLNRSTSQKKKKSKQLNLIRLTNRTQKKNVLLYKK